MNMASDMVTSPAFSTDSTWILFNMSNGTNVTKEPHMDTLLNGTFNGSERTLHFGIIAGAIFMLVVDIWAIASNILVFVVVFKTPHLRGHLTYLFVLNLCAVDLLCALTIMPLSIVTFLAQNLILGGPICNALGFFTALFTYASILNICIISIERFYCIKMPMHYSAHMTFCRALFAIIYIWSQSILLAALPLWGWNSYSFNSNTGHCNFSYGGENYENFYVIFIGIVGFLAPGIIILSMYVGIYRVAKQSARRIHPGPTPIIMVPPQASSTLQNINGSENERNVATAGADQTEITTPQEDGPDLQQQTDNRKNQSHWKAIKTVLCIVIIFMVLWGPYFILHVYGAAHGSLGEAEHYQLLTLWLGFLSYALNPFVYGFLNRAVREELLCLLQQAKSCLACKRQSDDCEENVPDNEDFFQFLERTSHLRSKNLSMIKENNISYSDTDSTPAF